MGAFDTPDDGIANSLLRGPTERPQAAPPIDDEETDEEKAAREEEERRLAIVDASSDESAMPSSPQPLTPRETFIQRGLDEDGEVQMNGKDRFIGAVYQSGPHKGKTKAQRRWELGDEFDRTQGGAEGNAARPDVGYEIGAGPSKNFRLRSPDQVASRISQVQGANARIAEMPGQTTKVMPGNRGKRDFAGPRVPYDPFAGQGATVLARRQGMA